MTAAKLLTALRVAGSPEQAAALARFFKTGPGQYGAGDRFLGVMVPPQRRLAKAHRDLPLPEVAKLLASPWHEARLTGGLILTYAYERAAPLQRQEIFAFLLEHRGALNNWDLVDVIAPRVIGEHLRTGPRERRLLYGFARSDDLWERRLSVVSTLAFLRDGDCADTLAICALLLGDEHDLIHKASGWLLREAGKRDPSALRAFLAEHATTMPRTMLRYAIERLPEAERRRWLAERRLRGRA